MTHYRRARILVGVALAIVPPAPSEFDARCQRHMEAMVRRLLRRTGDSSRLAAFPLAQALCEATGIPNAQLALRHVVEAAFRNGPREAELRHLILTSDLDARLTRTESATQFQVSRRHLQRYRAQAVSILARHIRDFIGSVAFGTVAEGESFADPLETLGEMISKIDPSTAARVISLGGARLADRAQMLDVRSRLEAGADIDASLVERRHGLPHALAAVLRAQSKEINGKHAEANLAVRALFGESDRGVVYDPETRFELEWLALLRARHRGDAGELRRIACNLQRVAQDRAGWLTRALVARADSELRFGRIREANETLDDADRLSVRNFAIGQLASSGALRAEIALLAGDDLSAERLASGAYIVLRGRHYDAYRCLATVARARLRLGTPWASPSDLDALAPSAFDRLGLEVECARHFHDDGLTQRARDCATRSYEAAVSLNYESVAARAAATIGSTYDRTSRARRSWHGRACMHLLRTRDRSLACDLFARDPDCVDASPRVALDPDMLELLYTSLTTSVPQLAMDEANDGRVARAFLAHLGRYVLGPTPQAAPLQEAVRSIGSHTTAFAYFLMRFLDDVDEIVRPFFVAIAPRNARPDVERRLSAAMRDVAQNVRPGDTRQYLVG